MWQCQTLVVSVALEVLSTVHADIARDWTLFQVITTCSSYRKQCFLDPVFCLAAMMA